MLGLIWFIIIVAVFIRAEYRHWLRSLERARTRELRRQLRIRRRILLTEILLGEVRKRRTADVPRVVITERKEVTQRQVELPAGYQWRQW